MRQPCGDWPADSAESWCEVAVVSSSLRQLVPTSLHGAVERSYLQLGRATPGIRMKPAFVMVGASRSGTTSLFRALSAHPQVLRPAVNKGVRYFDLNYGRPRSWYYGHFPVARPSPQPKRVTFEASGYYLFHPFAVERLARELPDVRIVVMLRNPVHRAFSSWKHESSRGYEWETFERSLELEEDRLAGEVSRMAADVTYESFCHRHQAHRSRGQYAEQMERVFANFPREQVHVVISERFFHDPVTEYARLLRFLELDKCIPESFRQHNAEPSSPMLQGAQRELEAHYRQHNRDLEDLLHDRLDW